MTTVVFPSRGIDQYISRFIEQRGPSEANGRFIPLLASTEACLIVNFHNRIKTRSCDTGAVEVVPRSLVVGPQSYRRVELCLDDEIHAFAIIFQPTGFHRLFSIPMTTLLNRSEDTHAVLGASFLELEEALVEAPSLRSKVQIAEKFLARQAERSNATDRISRLTTAIIDHRGAPLVQDLAIAAGISDRQLYRNFIEQTGLPPKMFGRVVRFNAAFRTKVFEAPNERWTDIAQDSGYSDHSHMLRDFRYFSGNNPTHLASEFGRLPKVFVDATLRSFTPDRKVH